MILLLKFLILAGGIFVALIGLRSRVWGIALIAFLLPTYLIRFRVASIPFTFLEFCILLLFMIFCIMDSRSFPWWGRAAWVSIAVLFCASLVGLLVTPNLVQGLGLWKAYIVEPVMVFLIMSTVKTKRDVGMILYGLGLASIVVSIVALIQYGTGIGIPEPWQNFPDRRAVSVYGYPNAVGLFLAPIITMCSGFLLFGKRAGTFVCARWLCWLVVVTGGLALFAAKVEGAEIAVAVAILVTLLFTQWRWLSVSIFTAGILVALMIDRLRAIFFFQDISGDVRIALWKGTLNLLRAHPFVGAGLAGFPAAYDQFRLASHVELLLYPHNILFDFWVEFGLLGALWIIGMIVWIFHTLIRRFSSSSLSCVLFGVMITYGVYGLVDVVYFKNDLAVLWWIMIGFVFFVQTKNSEHI